MRRHHQRAEGYAGTLLNARLRDRPPRRQDFSWNCSKFEFVSLIVKGASGAEVLTLRSAQMRYKTREDFQGQ